MEQNQIITMFNVGRTGSTWISSLIGNHSRIIDAGETNFFADTLDEVGIVGRYNILSLHRSFSSGNAFVPLPISDMSTKDIYGVMRRHTIDIYDTFLNRIGCQDSFVLDKSPAHMLSSTSIREMREILPEARPFHLIRDLRDVYLSYLRKYPEYWLLEDGINGFCDIIDAVYRTFIEEYGDVQTMRYEDVMRDPVTHISNTMELIGVDMDDPSFIEAAVDRGAPKSNWENYLPSPDAEIIWNRLGWIMRKYGYEE